MRKLTQFFLAFALAWTGIAIVTAPAQAKPEVGIQTVLVKYNNCQAPPYSRTANATSYETYPSRFGGELAELTELVVNWNPRVSSSEYPKMVAELRDRDNRVKWSGTTYTRTNRVFDVYKPSSHGYFVKVKATIARSPGGTPYYICTIYLDLAL